MITNEKRNCSMKEIIYYKREYMFKSTIICNKIIYLDSPFLKCKYKRMISRELSEKTIKKLKEKELI